MTYPKQETYDALQAAVADIVNASLEVHDSYSYACGYLGSMLIYGAGLTQKQADNLLDALRDSKILAYAKQKKEQKEAA